MGSISFSPPAVNEPVAGQEATKRQPILGSNGKALAKRWDHIFSPDFVIRKPSRMQSLHVTLSDPGILSLGPGAPRSQYIPIDYVDIKIPTVPKFSEAETNEHGESVRIGKYDIRNGKSEYDLSRALDYAQGTGSWQLVNFMTEHVEKIHNPPYGDWKCVLTPGNTFMLDLAFRMFMKRGDYMLVEQYTYSTALETGEPMGVRYAGIPMDEGGMIPEELESIMSNWDPVSRGAPKPKVLYTVPTGQNPTGYTLDKARREAIYSICCKHDIYILEDDPYYYIQMHNISSTPGSCADFAAKLIPSFLSLDTEGRVMRMDSFSKVMAAGSRLGWVTASEQIIEKIVRAHEVSVQNPSGLAQIVAYKIVHDQWGHDGFSAWMGYLQSEYAMRRDAMIKICEDLLPAAIVSWSVPPAGFFLWLKIEWQKHPDAATKGVRQIEQELYNATIEKGALFIPGSWFQSDPDEILPTMFVRLTYAALDVEKMPEAIRRFGTALRQEFKLD